MLMMSCSGVSLNKLNTTIYETRQQTINRNSIPYNPVVVDLSVDINKKNIRFIDTTSKHVQCRK